MIQVNFVGELPTHLVQGRLGPSAKPIQHASVEQRRRRCSPILEAVRRGIHGEHDVEIQHYLSGGEEWGGEEWGVEVSSGECSRVNSGKMSVLEREINSGVNRWG